MEVLNSPKIIYVTVAKIKCFGGLDASQQVETLGTGQKKIFMVKFFVNAQLVKSFYLVSM